jgi:co-chaperonin GroES (HSP10)
MSSLYVEPSETHWLNSNKKEWSAAEVEEFIKSHCQGLDVIRPCGTQLLLIEPEIPETITKNGIIIPNSHAEDQIRATSVARVLDFGPDAYKSTEMFPSGPYCKRGDWVLYYRYERRFTRIMVNHKPMLLINVFDDKILNVVKDPSYIDGTPVG